MIKRAAYIAIAWLAAAVLFGAPAATIAACQALPASSPSTNGATIVLDIDSGDRFAAHIENQGSQRNPCQVSDQPSIQIAPAPAQRLPDDALIEAIGGMDRYAASIVPAFIQELFPGLSPPPESPPPKTSAPR